MSLSIPAEPKEVSVATPPGSLPVSRKSHMSRKRLWRWVASLLLCMVLGGFIWLGRRLYKTVVPSTTAIPVTAVKRSDLTLTASARGELRGGHSEMLTAPLTSGGEMHLTFLRKTGELVKLNDTVIEFDPTDQEYKLKEAQSDVSESKLKVTQAQAQAEAETEEARYALAKAESDIRVAVLDSRKNPVLPAITARQNDLALQSAKDRAAQLTQDLANRGETNAAAIAVQQANLAKAEIQAATAQKNIDSLTIRAKHEGYVSLRPNTQGNFMYGMSVPDFQVGDTVRAGMVLAEIPDLKEWEASANFGELDRGHIKIGQNASVKVIALPGRKLTGSVSDLGGTGGPPWNRRFECKIRLDHPPAELRPGMSVSIELTTDILPKALWLPAQAVFESGSRTFVYVPSAAGFTTKDIQLIRRSESQVVISGLAEGQLVALADPEQEANKKDTKSGGPALPK